MEPVAVFTIVAVAVTVLVLAAYLIALALVLRRVGSRLETVVSALRAVSERTTAAGPLLEAIGAELDGGRAALERPPGGGSRGRPPRAERAGGDPSLAGEPSVPEGQR